MTDPATIRSLDSLIAFLVQEPESFENGAIQLALMPMPITCTDYFSLLFHCFRFGHILDPWPPRGWMNKIGSRGLDIPNQVWDPVWATGCARKSRKFG